MHNDSWHWIDGEKDPMALGPRVTQNNWGIGEPGISKIMLISNQIITHNFSWWRLCCHGLRNGMGLECCKMCHFR